MRYKFYREHKYVSFALNDLERSIAKTDFSEFFQIEKIKGEFLSVIDMLKGHAQYENESLHELLRKKGSSLYEEAENDHKHYDEQLESLQKKLNEVQMSPDEEERIELGFQFYLLFRKFVGENLLHLHEEETVILPELQRLYNDDELREVEFGTYRQMTSAQLVEMMDVLFPHMNPTDRAVFLGEIKYCQPEKFIEVWEVIQTKLDTKEKEFLIGKLGLAQTTPAK